MRLLVLPEFVVESPAAGAYLCAMPLGDTIEIPQLLGLLVVGALCATFGAYCGYYQMKALAKRHPEAPRNHGQLLLRLFVFVPLLGAPMAFVVWGIGRTAGLW